MTLLLFTSGVLTGQPAENFDIYLFEVKSNVVTQLTSIEGAGEFNPSFSPSGLFIVHDVIFPAESTQQLYVTSTRTGVSRPLKGGDGGNDASWSPFEFLIAFDRAPAGDPSVYTVPFLGNGLLGCRRRLIRENAVDPDWSPLGNRLVFADVTDGSLRTISIVRHHETIIAPFGINPAWSPNGRYVAYSDGNNIFRVSVNLFGHAVSPPEQLTFDDPGLTFNQQPSWSADSRHIVFHSNRDNAVFNFDIWSVPASGGTPVKLTGLEGSGDFDPAFSQKHKLVAYAGFTAPVVLTAPLVTAQFRLDQNTPNPFSASTSIEFELPEKGAVAIEIRNYAGNIVRTLTNATYERGIHTLAWDRVTDNGGIAPGGYYFYTIKTSGFVQAKRLMIRD